MSDSRKQFERKEILIWPDQEQAVQSDADIYYPDLITPKGKRRNFSPLIRDIIDFWADHRPLFFRWRASRGDTPRRPIL